MHRGDLECDAPERGVGRGGRIGVALVHRPGGESGNPARPPAVAERPARIAGASARMLDFTPCPGNKPQ